MTKPTCFVIMGYGIKTDYPTGRKLDLDKTFKNIIKPVFDDLGFLCFRAADIAHSGVIDVPMYENIIKADFVVADISTANANAIYELGVRHAVRPHTTLVIAEKGFTYPFDLNHIMIDSYEHLETDIGYDEVIRFREVLKNKVIELRSKPRVDSPLYTFFPNLNQPHFTSRELREIEKELDDDDQGESLSDLVTQAEVAKDAKDFNSALAFLNKARKISPNDPFIIQRMTLVTYYSEYPDKVRALFNALDVLDKLQPITTTDPETLGLAGAIYKRLYLQTNIKEYLAHSINSYERGFYIKQDYYNGINLSYLYNLKAVNEEDKIESIADFVLANRIREKTIRLIDTIIQDSNFEQRDDKQWIYLTMAECYFALSVYKSDNTESYHNLYMQYKDLAEGIATEFALSTFNKQLEDLSQILNRFKDKNNLVS